ncbi:ATP-binding protein [Clostridium pasteurianum]|uniref:Histidine kinase n=1 Tax=Clostridium pasteurianum BC1 TaxID=86416 RepID=R4KAW1_CLOPA|nr:ATP-binding protein [Clostridium pasteurianum]AGK97654.1 histidine kinase [Clostridium pasteurianum BC1]
MEYSKKYNRTPKINNGYELYQTITDFSNPLEIFREAFQNAVDEDATEIYCKIYCSKELSQSDLYIDILDNGKGLKKNRIDDFFGLANSSKIDKNKSPIKGKLGYKGHGTKIFFNSEQIKICSKVEGDYWAAEMIEAVKQIKENDTYKYSDPMNPKDLNIEIPSKYKTGFFMSIKNPKYFNLSLTKYMLTHIYIRDYIKWFTVFGTVRTYFDSNLADKGIKLFLQGLDIGDFKEKYSSIKLIEPLPVFKKIDGELYEEIKLGHYFIEKNRTNETDLRKYRNKIESNKQYYDFYSKKIYPSSIESVVCDDNQTKFNLIIYVEGYETKRRYDVLLSRKGATSINKNLLHSDGERYGIWACKGGVPIEKVDDWIEGGKGINTYTYLHAFLDCDEFELTANRGSIRNTDLEKLQLIKKKLNEIFETTIVKNAIKERTDIERDEKNKNDAVEDKKFLKERYKASQNKSLIKLPIGNKCIFEPAKLKKNKRKKVTYYSESETLVFLINLINIYPLLFDFTLLDYNTTKGIDLVVENNSNPKYIELKGTMTENINHGLANIFKFICYNIDFSKGDTITDGQYSVKLEIIRDCKFSSNDPRFRDKKYTRYILKPEDKDLTVINPIEIIVLEKLLTEVLDADVN